jgi:hypothetical protein
MPQAIAVRARIVLAAASGLKNKEIAANIKKTLETRSKEAIHWSLRTLAREIGQAPSTVLPRSLRASGVLPGGSRIAPRPSNSLRIPEGNAAAIFSCGGSLQLWRRCATSSGFTCHRLNAPLCSVPMRKARCTRRHRAKEFRRFLDEVEKSVPADLDVLIVHGHCNSEAIQRHAQNQAHPRLVRQTPQS